MDKNLLSRIATQAETATIALGLALESAEATHDVRLIAQVRSRRDEVRKLRDDARQAYLDASDTEAAR